MHPPPRQSSETGPVHSQASKNCSIMSKSESPAQWESSLGFWFLLHSQMCLYTFSSVQVQRPDWRAPHHKQLEYFAHSLFGLMNHTFFAVWGSALWGRWCIVPIVWWFGHTPEKQELVSSNTTWLRCKKGIGKENNHKNTDTPIPPKIDSLPLSELITMQSNLCANEYTKQTGHVGWDVLISLLPPSRTPVILKQEPGLDPTLFCGEHTKCLCWGNEVCTPKQRHWLKILSRAKCYLRVGVINISPRLHTPDVHLTGKRIGNWEKF